LVEYVHDLFLEENGKQEKPLRLCDQRNHISTTSKALLCPLLHDNAKKCESLTIDYWNNCINRKIKDRYRALDNDTACSSLASIRGILCVRIHTFSVCRLNFCELKLKYLD
jgi:hypothetical protein